MNIFNYRDHHFENGGGTTTEEYKKFQQEYINYLKKVCKANDWEITKVLRGHYEFSLFIKNSKNHYVYLSICDVRYFHNQWYNHILIRGALHDEDYVGMHNEYTSLEKLPSEIGRIFRFLARKNS